MSDEILNIFFEECDELLPALEDGLNELSEGEHNKETINAIFRSVHSIKGGAASFGLDRLVKFAHVYESALDGLRSGDIKPDKDILSIFFTAMDVLSDLVNDEKEGEQSVDEYRLTKSISSLESIISEAKPSKEESAEPEIEFTPVAFDFNAFDDLGNDEPASKESYKVTFKPYGSLYQRGDDARNLILSIRDLCDNQDDFKVTCHHDGVKTLEDVSESEPTLSWTLEFPVGEATEDDIKSVFEWVDDACDLLIEKTSEKKTDEGNEAPTEAVSEKEIIKTPQETIIKESDENLTVITPVKNIKKAPKKKDHGSSIRVDVDRVNSLMDMVGEMVIAQASLEAAITGGDKIDTQELVKRLYSIKGLTRDIQSNVMSMRAQPIGNVFQRMQRVVREASAIADKKINLVVEGEDTEVDRTLIENLGEPLTHMLRNAIDHGIEPTEKRVEEGKPEEGTIVLSASHRSGRIIIEITDDGGGINKKKVYNIAAQKGIISPHAQLNDDEINELIFAPGFSTADKVSDLSGRGVGMDVVKDSIHTLGGRVSIKSIEGKGTKFTLSLPLTLAVMDGMLIQCCGCIMVVPVASVVELVTANKTHDVYDMPDGSKVVSIRKQSIPIIYLGEALGIPDDRECQDKTFIGRHEGENDLVLLVVENESGSKAALVVDGVKDQTQVVIKSIENNYRHINGVSAATILGDGSVSLILDISTLISQAAKKLNTRTFEK